jgi:hypothetical protein
MSEGLAVDLNGLAGEELVRYGIEELRARKRTESALLMLVAGPRLRGLGIDVHEPHDIAPPYEHRLYEYLAEKYGDSAYRRYNAMIRRIVSFARAMEHRKRRAHEKKRETDA